MSGIKQGADLSLSNTGIVRSMNDRYDQNPHRMDSLESSDVC